MRKSRHTEKVRASKARLGKNDRDLRNRQQKPNQLSDATRRGAKPGPAVTSRALWEANELLEAMFSAIDLMVAYLDSDFNFIRVNRAYAEMDGREPSFYVGKNHFALFPNSENEAIFRRVVATGEQYAVHAKPFQYAEHPERGVSYWDWNVQPVKDATGQVTGVVLSLVNVTERIQAELALRESEERFFKAFHASPAATVISRFSDGIIVAANDCFLDLFGYTCDELVGHTSAELGLWARPEDRALILERLENEHSVRGVEVGLCTKVGERKEALLSVEVIELRGERCMLAHTDDITERKRADAEVRANAARAETLARTAARLNAGLDLHTVIQTVCEEAAHALNAPGAWVNLYNPIRDTLDFADSFGLPLEFGQRYRSPSRALYEEHARKMGPLIVQPDVRTLAGIPNAKLYADLDVRTIANASLIREGQLVGVLSVPILSKTRQFSPWELALLQGLSDLAAQAITNARLHDQVQRHAGELEQRVRERTAQLETANEELQQQIEERELAEEQILKRNRELSVLYSITRATSQSLELRERLENAIESALQALDMEAGAIYLVEPDGKTMTLRTHRGLSDEFVKAVARFEIGEGIAGKAVIEKHTVVLDISDYPSRRMTPFVLREGLRTLVSLPLLMAGQALGAFNLATRRVRAFPPEELKLLNAIGQQLGVAVQHAQLFTAVQQLNTDLERRATELETANRELEAFSYSVSHDLRTPLHATEEFSRLLLEECGDLLPPVGRRYAELANGNAKAMIELVNGLLDFSRLGSQPLRKQTVDPTELAREAMAELARGQERCIEFSVEELPPCQADPLLLKQVFVNLLSNALKFTRTRPIARINVGCQRLDETSSTSQSSFSNLQSPTPQVAYFVRDNGVGFDMEAADRLFGVFQRLHTPDEYEGTGVGLAIVARVIHRHGGRVWAEAEPDKGATFNFTL